MKALVHTKPFEFELQDWPVPQTAADEVLVRVKAVGICGSDVHGMTGRTGRRIPPIIMGHEAAGIIEKVGAAVKKFDPGDRVTFDSTIYCNRCPRCLKGEINLCLNRKVLGVSTGEYRCHGAMAEFVAVPEHILYSVPEGLSLIDAAVVEPVSIAFHAVRRARVELNDSVLVVGCGIIGLFLIQAAKLAGCGEIIAADVDPFKLGKAKEFGANHLINCNSTDPGAILMDLTNEQGVDVSFEAVGANQTVNLVLAATKKGGKVVLVGNVSPEISWPLQKHVTGELTVFGSCASAGEYQACIDMMAAGRINARAMVSNTAPLADGALWFNKLHEAKEPMLKVILEP